MTYILYMILCALSVTFLYDLFSNTIEYCIISGKIIRAKLSHIFDFFARIENRKTKGGY